jgi:KAP family P-loop domain
MEAPGRIVWVLDDGHSESEELAVREDLADVLVRAATINESFETQALTFTSLLLGILHAPDPMSKSVQDYFKRAGIDVGYLFRKRGATPQQVAGLLTRSDEEKYGLLEHPMQRSESARRVLLRAKEILQVSHGPDTPLDPMDVRHLVAAFIAEPDYHEDDFKQLRLDRVAWGQSFLSQVSAVYPSESPFWKRFFAETFPGIPLKTEQPQKLQSEQAQANDGPRVAWRRADFDADVATDRDLVGIRRDVEALAYLATSTKTTPPLSIGLFGDWGSGKTFFMSALKRRISEITAAARGDKRSQDEVACFRNVAQIEFNAWHYSESNLWASMVEHIFQNLRISDDEEERLLAERRDKVIQLLGQNEIEAKTADALAAQAKENLDAKEQEVARLDQAQADKRAELGKVTASNTVAAVRAGLSLDAGVRREVTEALQAAGVHDAGAAAEDVQKTLDHALAEVSRASEFLRPLLQRSGWSRFGLLALAVVAPLAVGFLFRSVFGRFRQAELGKIVGGLTTLLGFVGVVTTWIGKQVDRVARLREKLVPLKKKIDATIEAQQNALASEQAKEIAVKIQELDQLRIEYTDALRAREQARTAKEALELELARTSTTYRLGAFIDDRARSTDYRKHLGLAALIRRDFEKLSRLVETENKRLLGKPDGQSNGAPEVPGGIGLNRIILYIDDLDRCPEQRVVDVLRAVHLLLAFPLFVVVVGVDSRWVARCLEQRYSGLLRRDDTAESRQETDVSPGRLSNATALDYLEKIFQIPIWLSPIPQAQRVNMVQTLFTGGAPGPASAKPESALAPKSVRAPAKRPADLETVRAALPSSHRAPGPLTIQTIEPAVSTLEATAIELDPPGLDISRSELEFVAQLGPLLSRSPRVLKRFVNTYRLLKVGLSDHEQRAFVTDDPHSDHRVCLLQLAVLVGMPELSARFVNALARGSDNDTLLTLVEYLRSGPGGQQTVGLEDLHSLSDWLDTSTTSAAIPVSLLARWAPRVARFTFNLRQG